MALDFQRIYVGELDVSKASRFLSFSVGPYSDAAFEAIPRYGSSLGSWNCKIQQSVAGTPNDFSTPIAFTSSVNYVASQNMSSVGTISFTTTTAGSSGIVDIWAICKAIE